MMVKIAVGWLNDKFLTIDALITRDNKAFPRKKMAILNVKEALHLISING